MITLSQGLPNDLVRRLSRTTHYGVQPPAADFTHNGRLNMGPAICLAVTLSLVGWGGVFGAAYMLVHWV